MPSFHNETVTVTRPRRVASRGTYVDDWTSPVTFVVGGCHCQPVDASTEREGRESQQTTRARLYAPTACGIARGDRVSALGETWVVTEASAAWPSPTGRLAHRQFVLERWEG